MIFSTLVSICEHRAEVPGPEPSESPLVVRESGSSFCDSIDASINQSINRINQRQRVDQSFDNGGRVNLLVLQIHVLDDIERQTA